MSLMIDYITMPPKSQEVSQIQCAEQTKMNQSNQEVVAQFQQQIQHDGKQTVRRTKAENEELKYRDKDGKNGKNKKKSGHNGHEEDPETKEKKSSSDGSHFDIRI